MHVYTLGGILNDGMQWRYSYQNIDFVWNVVCEKHAIWVPTCQTLAEESPRTIP
jgi:hypothetical protein